MVVDLSDTKLTASVLHNSLNNRFQVTVPEQRHFGLLLHDKLAHHVQHEGGQSGRPYHVVLLPDRVVLIRQQGVPEWHNMQHELGRHIREGRILYRQSKYQSARTMIRKIDL
jgi:hypothetical protein